MLYFNCNCNNCNTCLHIPYIFTQIVILFDFILNHLTHSIGVHFLNL